MADRRTRRQKLEAMANQTVSPNEAEVAKRKLAEMGPELQPYQRRYADYVLGAREFDLAMKNAFKPSAFESVYVYHWDFTPKVPVKCKHGLSWYHCFITEDEVAVPE